jgi:hypothetical protein
MGDVAQASQKAEAKNKTTKKLRVMGSPQKSEADEAFGPT